MLADILGIICQLSQHTYRFFFFCFATFATISLSLGIRSDWSSASCSACMQASAGRVKVELVRLTFDHPADIVEIFGTAS